MQTPEWWEIYHNDLHSYTLEQLRYNPLEDVWSLGQMYLHLIDVADEYFGHAETCEARAEEQPLGKTEAGVELRNRGGFPPIRIKAPGDAYDQPNSKEELFAGLEQVRLRLIEWEKKADSINPNYKVKHDGFGWLNAREWIDLIGMHFRHHFRQKAELEQNLNL